MISIFLINTLLLSRIIYTFDDNKLKNKQIPYYLCIQVIGFAILSINKAWIFLVLSAVVANALIILWEKKSKHIRVGRITALILLSLVYIIFTTKSDTVAFNPIVISYIKKTIEYNSIFDNVNEVARLNTYILGLLFILNESNIIIRQLFDWLKITPKESEEDQQDDEAVFQSDKYIIIDEYKSGRVIGILERVFVYFAVILNEYSIIGFILAAKAFARFKELENKAFAEYVLIGTLSSILLSFIVANLIILLIN